MSTILIVSLCSTHRGDMESQLGNMAIFIPTVRLLREYLGPSTRILTTFQFSDAVREELKLDVISDTAMTQWSVRQTPGLVLDLLKALAWKSLRLLGLDVRLFRSGTRLRWFSQADVVLSLNGDVFGDNSSRAIRLIRHWADLVLARLLGKPIVEYAGSPGPFTKPCRGAIAHGYFKTVHVITNREPISTERLNADGFRHPAMIDTACPAFALQASSSAVAERILLAEGVTSHRRPWIGMALCGYNLLSERTWKPPASLRDVRLYVDVAQSLVEKRHVTLVFIPHVHRWNPWTGEWIHGLDWLILRQLRELLLERGVSENNVILFDGCYSAPDTKAVLGKLDMHVTGRLHAGVAALSQCVPTVLIAYGHKHHGFARIAGQERCVVDMYDPEALTQKALEVFDDRVRVRSQLEARMPEVLGHVRLNFEIISDLVRTATPLRCIPSAELVAGWKLRASQWGGSTE